MNRPHLPGGKRPALTEPRGGHPAFAVSPGAESHGEHPVYTGPRGAAMHGGRFAPPRGERR